MADLSARDSKLVQYLNEAYGKEKELETALQAHIAMTTRAPYRKRLQEHLTETKRHANEVERRVKQLGGEAEVLPLPGPGAVSQAAGAAVELGSRAVAAAKGPLHAIRGTGEQEKMLKNAKTEYSEEHEEIATYQAIETLASSLGDTATAQLARAIRREEERMASFLARLIPTLTKAVIQEEIPAAERRAANGGRRTRSKRSAAAKRSTGTKRSTAARSKRSGAAKATGAAKRATGTAKRASGTAKRSGAGAAKRAAGGAKRAAAKTRAGARSAASGTSARASSKAAKRSPAGGVKRRPAAKGSASRKAGAVKASRSGGAKR